MRPGQAKGPSVTKSSGGGLAAVTTADTNTVDLTGDGTGGLPLEADVIVDPAAGNALQSLPGGLYVAPTLAAVATTDTDSVDLSGDGSVGTPLQADLNLTNLNRNALQVVGAAGPVTKGGYSLHGPQHTFNIARVDATTLPLFEVTAHTNASYLKGQYLVALTGSSWDYELQFVISVFDGGYSQITMLHNWTNFLGVEIINDIEVWFDNALLKFFVVAKSAAGQIGATPYRCSVIEIGQPEGLPIVGVTMYPSSPGVVSGIKGVSYINWVPKAYGVAADRYWGADGTGKLGWQPQVTPAQIGAIPATLLAVTKEPTGWDNPANVAVTYDIATRKITAKAISGTATAYWHGVALLTIDTVTGFTSAAHANTLDVAYYLYYNGSTWSFGNVPAETTPWQFDYLMLAFCYYGTADKWAIRECHGFMPYQSHQEDHYNIGTWRRPGATNYGAVTFTGSLPSGTTPARRRPSIAACELWDEDLVTTNPLQSSNYCPCYLTGAGAISTFLENNADIVPFASATTRAAYNNPNGGGAGVWGLTALATSEFTPVFAVQVPVTTDAQSQQYRIVHYLGQASYPSAAAAQAVEFNSLNLGSFFNIAPEFLVIQRYVIRGNNANDLWEVESTQQIVGYKANQISVASSGMVNPMTTLGDLIYASVSGAPATPARLGIGSANFDLGIVAGVPAWRASIYSLLTAGGQVLASSGANTPAAVAAGSAGQVLTSNGASAPTWQAPLSSVAPRTVPFYKAGSLSAGTILEPSIGIGAAPYMGYPVRVASTLTAWSVDLGSSTAGSAGDLVFRLAYLSAGVTQFSSGGGTTLDTLTIPSGGALASNYYRVYSRSSLSVAIPAGASIFCECTAVNTWSVTNCVAVVSYQ